MNVLNNFRLCYFLKTKKTTTMYSQKREEFDLTSSQSNLNRLNKAMKTFLVNHAETAAGSSPNHFCMFCAFVCLLRCHSNNRQHVKASQLSLPLSPHPVGLITTSCSVPQPLKKTNKKQKSSHIDQTEFTRQECGFSEV